MIVVLMEHKVYKKGITGGWQRRAIVDTKRCLTREQANRKYWDAKAWISCDLVHNGSIDNYKRMFAMPKEIRYESANGSTKCIDKFKVYEIPSYGRRRADVQQFISESVNIEHDEDKRMYTFTKPDGSRMIYNRNWSGDYVFEQ